METEHAGAKCPWDEDRWLSVEQIADYLGINRDTVYKWIERKNMPSHKVGRLWKFKKGQIDDWIEAGRAGQARSNAEDGLNG